MAEVPNCGLPAGPDGLQPIPQLAMPLAVRCRVAPPVTGTANGERPAPLPGTAVCVCASGNSGTLAIPARKMSSFASTKTPAKAEPEKPARQVAVTEASRRFFMKGLSPGLKCRRRINRARQNLANAALNG